MSESNKSKDLEEHYLSRKDIVVLQANIAKSEAKVASTMKETEAAFHAAKMASKKTSTMLESKTTNVTSEDKDRAAKAQESLDGLDVSGGRGNSMVQLEKLNEIDNMISQTKDEGLKAALLEQSAEMRKGLEKQTKISSAAAASIADSIGQNAESLALTLGSGSPLLGFMSSFIIGQVKAAWQRRKDKKEARKQQIKDNASFEQSLLDKNQLRRDAKAVELREERKKEKESTSTKKDSKVSKVSKEPSKGIQPEKGTKKQGKMKKFLDDSIFRPLKAAFIAFRTFAVTATLAPMLLMMAPFIALAAIIGIVGKKLYDMKDLIPEAFEGAITAIKDLGGYFSDMFSDMWDGIVGMIPDFVRRRLGLDTKDSKMEKAFTENGYASVGANDDLSDSDKKKYQDILNAGYVKAKELQKTGMSAQKANSEAFKGTFAEKRYKKIYLEFQRNQPSMMPTRKQTGETLKKNAAASKKAEVEQKKQSAKQASVGGMAIQASTVNNNASTKVYGQKVMGHQETTLKQQTAGI